MSSMIFRQERGYIDVWLVLFIVITLLFLGSVGFGVWAFMGRQNYKNNSDAISATAVSNAIAQEDQKKDAAFAQAEKQPYATYVGPDAYGSVHVVYPKTWSVYADSTGQGTQPVDAFFNPGFVPSIVSSQSSFALRMQVNQSSYTSLLTNFQGYVSAHQSTATPFAFPKVPSVVGTRIDGIVEPGKTGSLVLVPLRDKTLEVWTDTPSFMNDFNNVILQNLTFSP